MSARTRRRDFLRLPVAAAGAAALPAARPQSSGARRRAIDEYDPANIKVATRLYLRTATDDDLLFLKQIGMRWVHAEFGANASYDMIKSSQERLSRFGIKIYVGVMDAYRSVKVQLGQPGRDEEIARFQTFLRDLGRLGVPAAKIDFHPGNVYTTKEIETPRGYKAREFSVDDFRSTVEKRRFDRDYSADDMWANYTYFIKAVLPVAEQASVRLALHPDDPPITPMNGVAKLFINYDGIKRAEQIAGSSKHWGLMYCVGTWSEGGDKMGKNVFEMIQDFGSRGKIVAVHFRNVSSPLPRFYETFQDDGYQDMYQIMKAFRQVKFAGSMVPDHIPEMKGDDKFRRAGHAYTVAFIRSLLRRANEEVG